MKVRSKVLEVLDNVTGWVNIEEAKKLYDGMACDQMLEILWQLEEYYEVSISDDFGKCLDMDLEQFITLVDIKVKEK